MARMSYRRWIAGALSLAALVFVAASARAQDHWGAVAAGPDGASAQAVAQPSREAARAAAIKGCGGRCTHLVTFYRACGAIAIRTGGFGWAVSATAKEAGDGAVRFCAQRGEDCSVRIAACSGND